MAGSGFGDFQINTPSQSLQQAALAQGAASRATLEAATLPDDIAMSGLKRDSSTLALADQKKASQVKNVATDEALIANAAALATDSDTWDQAMQTLADKGVDEARQYIGRFSTELQGRVTRAYSAGSPSAALAAGLSDNPTGLGGPESGLAGAGAAEGAGQTNGAQATNFDQLFAGHTPEQLQASFDHLEKMRAAITAVSQSQNPAAEWAKQVQALGIGDQAGPYSPQALQQAAQDIIPVDNYLRGRMMRGGAGVGPPKIPAKIDNVGGVMYSVDMTDPSHPKSTAMTPQGKSVLVGTDKDGVGIYYDSTTGKETKGSIPLNAKPGTNGQKQTVYSLKQAAWLQAHPGDTQGALDYAGGLKGKNLSPEQIQVAATMAASRELADAAMAGAQIPDAQAFITERTAQLVQQITTAGIGAQAPATPPANAKPQERSGYPVLTLPQAQEAAKNPANRGKGYYGADGQFRRF
jgi:hypothetical protein